MNQYLKEHHTAENVAHQNNTIHVRISHYATSLVHYALTALGLVNAETLTQKATGSVNLDMILDATAGNRTIYTTKDVSGIIYIDVELKLEHKPTIFADNTNTPFLDKTFDTIFYDPPHAYGVHTGRHVHPSKAAAVEVGAEPNEVSCYYGWDKYETQMALINHIHKAQKEFKRILKDDGLLWLKWNEVTMQTGTIMNLFDGWTEVMRILVSQAVRPAGTRSTYWICLSKKKERIMQAKLF